MFTFAYTSILKYGNIKEGTPQKNKARTIPSGKVQVNYNMDGDKAEKFKTIAFNHGIAQSDVYNKAAEKFLQLYEKNMGLSLLSALDQWGLR